MSTTGLEITLGDGAYWLNGRLFFAQYGRRWRALFIAIYPFVIWNEIKITGGVNGNEVR